MQAIQPKPLKWLWIGLGVPIGGLAIAAVSLVIFFSFGPAGGVRVTSTLEPYAKEYLETNRLLEADETVIAYYDATIALKGTEAAILTDRRVLYHRPGGNSSILLQQVARIEHEEQPVTGDVIRIFAESGELLVIEIAPLNGGLNFLSALENQVALARRVSQGQPTPHWFQLAE
ncbi:hypothetical protein PGN35_015600 [Nodosilinea sp. PGN35]|uniref:hypothetical protein n=1 Tax=Nodosilinea sp. PGN35 TaxID=3020489 RepID=UPI0023B33BC0|nr:hypothetical protein [Nodosilinea sp. TSF1-S3]MDF0368109.1 hypothetical protein [Nodosilinea sp. TSF1-S3]